MFRKYLRRVLGVERLEENLWNLYRTVERVKGDVVLGLTPNQRLDSLEKTIKEAQTQMIAEAKTWREIAYAIGDKTAIRAEIAKRDSRDVAAIKEKLDA